MIGTIDFQYNDVNNLLEYIEQLETREQKLIEFCEINKYVKIPGIKEMMEEILSIVKGENIE